MMVRSTNAISILNDIIQGLGDPRCSDEFFDVGDQSHMKAPIRSVGHSEYEKINLPLKPRSGTIPVSEPTVANTQNVSEHTKNNDEIRDHLTNTLHPLAQPNIHLGGNSNEQTSCSSCECLTNTPPNVCTEDATKWYLDEHPSLFAGTRDRLGQIASFTSGINSQYKANEEQKSSASPNTVSQGVPSGAAFANDQTPNDVTCQCQQPLSETKKLQHKKTHQTIPLPLFFHVLH